MKKRITMLLCTLMAVSLTLAGCSGASNAPSGESTGQAVESVSQGGDASSQAASQEEKLLIEGRSSDSATLDPFNATDIASWRVSRQIYDNLVGFEPGSFNVAPSLATAWTTSDDGKTWTFTLAEGVQFHDGTDFNADAVVFNIERWWDESHPYHNGTFANVTSFYGGFKGDPNCVIQDVQAVDEYTVQITLNSVFPALLTHLSDPTSGIISPAAIEKYGEAIGQNPVGTGPFMFREWKPNDSITLVKNPNYWQSGLPKLDTLIFKVIPDNTARLIALQSGEIDLMDSLNPSDIDTVTGDGNLQIIARPPINCGFFWFNTTKPPFDNVKVRQAVSMAVNKQGIINALFNGKGIPAKSILSPSSWAYNAEMEDYPYDPEGAKALLAEAGYPDGLSTELWVRGEARAYFPQPLKIAQSMQADLAEIGIKVEIVTYEGATYSNKVYGAEFTMASWGTNGNDPDPGRQLDLYFNKIYTKTDVASNAARYVNDEVSELLTQAQSILDRDERASMYRKAQQIIHDEAPILPMTHSESQIAAASYVTGYIPFTDYFELYALVDIQK